MVTVLLGKVIHAGGWTVPIFIKGSPHSQENKDPGSRGNMETQVPILPGKGDPGSSFSHDTGKGTPLKTSIFWAYFQNSNLLCHNCPTHLSHECPPTKSQMFQSFIPIMFNFTLHVCANSSHGEHWCVSRCWCFPTQHTTYMNIHVTLIKLHRTSPFSYQTSW